MDFGVLYGAMVVERLRTFGGRLTRWDPHWDRMLRGCDALGIRRMCTRKQFGESLQRLLDINGSLLAEDGDVSLVALATPGNPDFGLGDCTLMLHVLRIPWQRLYAWYRDGARLISSMYASGAGSSWPAGIKVRNRLAYYLADRDAARGDARHLGLLRTADGHVGDTSVANVICISHQGEWKSPDPRSILVGTSLRWCESLMQARGVELRYGDIDFEEFKRSKEILLVGNTPCVWHASEVDGLTIGDGQPGAACRWLQQLWIERVGFDWLSQGLSGGHRTE